MNALSAILDTDIVITNAEERRGGGEGEFVFV